MIFLSHQPPVLRALRLSAKKELIKLFQTYQHLNEMNSITSTASAMTTGTSSSDCSRAARKLADLFASLPVSNQWGEVQQTAQKLANGLRIRSDGMF